MWIVTITSARARNALIAAGVPNGIRTRVAALKGRCPRPLDDGDNKENINPNRLGVKENAEDFFESLFFVNLALFIII